MNHRAARTKRERRQRLRALQRRRRIRIVEALEPRLLLAASPAAAWSPLEFDSSRVADAQDHRAAHGERPAEFAGERGSGGGTRHTPRGSHHPPRPVRTNNSSARAAESPVLTPPNAPPPKTVLASSSPAAGGQRSTEIFVAPAKRTSNPVTSFTPSVVLAVGEPPESLAEPVRQATSVATPQPNLFATAWQPADSGNRWLRSSLSESDRLHRASEATLPWQREDLRRPWSDRLILDLLEESAMESPADVLSADPLSRESHSESHSSEPPTEPIADDGLWQADFWDEADAFSLEFDRDIQRQLSSPHGDNRLPESEAGIHRATDRANRSSTSDERSSSPISEFEQVVESPGFRAEVAATDAGDGGMIDFSALRLQPLGAGKKMSVAPTMPPPQIVPSTKSPDHLTQVAPQRTRIDSQRASFRVFELASP